MALASAPPPAAPAPETDAAASLAAAERAFAATSVERGMKEAFLTWLAADGVVFRPLPANGRAVWSARPDPSATLAWEPAYAEVAASGDLGWTTGPWELRPAGADTAVAWGHFHSVWRREDGAWRVAADIGVSHPRPARGVGSGDFVSATARGRGGGRAAGGAASRPRGAGGAPDPAAGAALAARLDASLTRDGRGGAAGALRRHAAADVRLGLEGAAPVLGRAAAVAALDPLPGASAWRSAGGGVSASRSLAWSHGVLERRAARGAVPDSAAYLNVWRTGGDGRWELALAVLNPVR